MTPLFPDPRSAPGDGPLAVGQDFRPSTLLEAYHRGIFPWPDGQGAVYWWSPDPRAVIPVGTLHRSRSLSQRIRNGGFAVTIDTAFDEVTAGCADRPGEGTWITTEMREAYRRLHDLGHAHSVEVWLDDRLVGGLYGISIGGVFTGESMFHRVPDASKIALVALEDHLQARGHGVIDVQLHTDHLERMGAIEIPRAEFLDVLERLRTTATAF
jgi:leucyl/phenylalanyl-tRNA---protein transferase